MYDGKITLDELDLDESSVESFNHVLDHIIKDDPDNDPTFTSNPYTDNMYTFTNPDNASTDKTSTFTNPENTNADNTYTFTNPEETNTGNAASILNLENTQADNTIITNPENARPDNSIITNPENTRPDNTIITNPENTHPDNTIISYPENVSADNTSVFTNPEYTHADNDAFTNPKNQDTSATMNQSHSNLFSTFTNPDFTSTFTDQDYFTNNTNNPHGIYITNNSENTSSENNPMRISIHPDDNQHFSKSHWLDVAKQVKEYKAGVNWNKQEIERNTNAYCNNKRYTKDNLRLETRLFNTIQEHGGDKLKPLCDIVQDDGGIYEKRHFYNVLSGDKTDVKKILLGECLKLCACKWKNKKNGSILDSSTFTNPENTNADNTYTFTNPEETNTGNAASILNLENTQADNTIITS